MARRAAGASRPSPWRRFRGLVQASHPFPIAMVLTLTVLGGVASAGSQLPGGRLALAGAAMLFSQLAIGWSNDYLDRNSDALFQPEKPVPSGLVAATWLPWLVAASLTLSLAAGAGLGLVVLAWLLAGTACGFAYNLAFKQTALSWAPYVAAFALLPPFVWSATHSFQQDFLWLYPIGASLALAAHIANTLPDLESDALAGTRNLTVRLGQRGSLALLYGCLALPPVLVGLSLPWLDYDAALLAAVLVAFGLLIAASTFAYRARPFDRGAAMGFRLVAPAAVLLAVGWLAAVG